MNTAKKQRKTIEWERRDLFKKIGDIKGIFQASMGTINDRNCNETEVLKKKWQEYTEKVHNKVLNDLDNHNRVVTLLEPDVLTV